LLERVAVKGSTAVVPVCDALAVIADKHGSEDIVILRDISLLKESNETDDSDDLRKLTGIGESTVLILYIGNLEHYQGIDLLIESFKLATEGGSDTALVIIGGIEEHIKLYKTKSQSLGIANNIHLVGPKPVSKLAHYLKQADILVSPRTMGNNTPMKIYSYLHSGVPTVATDLPTHTQVMDRSVAELAAPNNKDYSAALKRLIENPERRRQLGKAAFDLAEEKYTFEVFSRELNGLYDRVGQKLVKNASAVAAN